MNSRSGLSGLALRLGVPLLTGVACRPQTDREFVVPAPEEGGTKLAPVSRTRPTDKKLIELGWDIPDTAKLRQTIEQAKKSPFDGCIFFVFYTRPGAKPGNLSREAWGRIKISETAVQPAIDDLKATAFGRFQENFARLDMIPGDVDWFEDFGSVLHNVGLLARVAKQGGTRGIFLDVEQYKARLFDYSQQARREQKSFVEYTRQVRQRGRAVMQAMQANYPGLTVYLAFGPSVVPLVQANNRPWRKGEYDLLPAFLDGLIDEASGRTKIVDGFESSYYFNRSSQFAEAYRLIHQETLSYVANPDRYKKRVTAGFALWLDRDWEKRGGWEQTNLEKNFYTPETMREFVAAALRATDRYVFLYSHNFHWYENKNIPTDYRNAIFAARRDAGLKALL